MIDPIKAILDENNNDNVILYNMANQPVEFEQIAIIPLYRRDFCILKPVRPMEGLGANEAFVFELVGDDDIKLNLIYDEKLIDDVFSIYNDLWRKRHK